MIVANDELCVASPSSSVASHPFDAPPGFDPNSHAAEIRRELRRVLDSLQFHASERNRRFLEYVVEETLAGRGGRIKAYNIATEVFGRDTNFDPQLDPVVRMEARRLRRSLERFYLTDGRNSPVRIAMPKGGYVVEFLHVPLGLPTPHAGLEKDSSSEPTGTERSLSILVTPFGAEGDQSIFKHFNRGFTEEIIIGLTRHPDISVFGSNLGLRHASTLESEPSKIHPHVDFVLTGGTALFAGFLNVKVVLVQASTGRVLWGQSFERELRPGNTLNVRDEVANSIVRILVQPYGVIFGNKAEAVRTKDPRRLSPLECIVKFYEYRRTYQRELFDVVRDSLQRTIDSNPDYVEATACLSQLFTDGHRFGFASIKSLSGLRQQAAELAHRAVAFAPNSSRSHHALGLACWFAQDLPASLKAMQTALALNPNATEVMTDLGLIWSLLGEWEQGVPLLEEASVRQPSQRGVNCVGLSLYHFMNGRYEDALALAQTVDMPDLAHGFVAQAISLVRLGRKSEAAHAVSRIAGLAQCHSRHVLTDLAGANVKPELVDKVLSALRDAGLQTEVTQH